MWTSPLILAGLANLLTIVSSAKDHTTIITTNNVAAASGAAVAADGGNGTVAAGAAAASAASSTTIIKTHHHQKKCAVNERYVKCPEKLCLPQVCEHVGFPLCSSHEDKYFHKNEQTLDLGAGTEEPCPGRPACVCIENFVRNHDGVCMPAKNCPSCGNDRNATYGCGINCGRRCSNYNKPPVECADECYPNMCDCKDGYVFDDYTKNCVMPEDCSNKDPPQPEGTEGTPGNGEEEENSTDPCDDCDEENCDVQDPNDNRQDGGERTCSTVGGSGQESTDDPNEDMTSTTTDDSTSPKEPETNRPKRTTTSSTQDSSSTTVILGENTTPDDGDENMTTSTSTENSEVSVTTESEQTSKSTHKHKKSKKPRTTTPVSSEDSSTDESGMTTANPDSDKTTDNSESDMTTEASDSGTTTKKSHRHKKTKKPKTTTTTSTESHLSTDESEVTTADPESESTTDASESDITTQKPESEVALNNSESKLSESQVATEKSDSNMTTEQSESEITSDPSESEMTTENSESEMTTEKSASEMTTENSESEITSDPSESEMTTENSETEMTTENAESEITSDPSESEMTTENSESEMTTEKSASEMTTENSESEITSDPSESEMTTEKSASEMTTENSESEITSDPSESEMTTENSETEMTTENAESEITSDPSESEMTTENSESEMTSDQSGSEMTTENSESDATSGSGETSTTEVSEASATEESESKTTESSETTTKAQRDKGPNECNGKYEWYYPCAPLCPQRTCTEFLNGVKCTPTRTGRTCRPECQCQPGYFTDAEGKCVTILECKNAARTETTTTSKSDASTESGDQTSTTERSEATSMTEGPNSETTIDPSESTTTGPSESTTLSREQKGPRECNGKDEWYYPCAPPCPQRSCTEFLSGVKCTPTILTLQCRPECQCQPGFFTDANDNCVSIFECKRLASLTTMMTSSTTETMSSSKSDATTESGNAMTTTEESESTTMTEGSDSTTTTDPSESTTTDPSESTTTDPSGSTTQPRQQKGPNECNAKYEWYYPCAPPCPQRTCTEFLSGVKCTPTSIILRCRPECQCQPGYFTDANGNCVSILDCKRAASSTMMMTSSTTANPDEGSASSTTSMMSTTPEPSCEDVAERLFIKGNLAYTMTILNDLAQSNPGTNVLCGGASILYLMGQLAMQAKGTLKTELLNVLNLQDTEQIRCFLPEVSKNLTATYTDIEYNLFCKIYADIDSSLTEDFIRITTEVFFTRPENLDFSISTSAETIDDTVAESTNNTFLDYIKPNVLSSLSSLLLVDAERFAGKWQKQFDPAETILKDFFWNGRIDKIPTMYQRGIFLYTESVLLHAKILKMMYKTEDFSMAIFLPNVIEGTRHLIRRMQNPDILASALDSLRLEDVQIYLPIFDVSVANRLKIPSIQANVVELFNNATTGLEDIVTSGNAYVSEILQKIKFQVNEHGMGDTLNVEFPGIKEVLRPSQNQISYLFKADHPFVYCLFYKKIMLFAGAFEH